MTTILASVCADELAVKPPGGDEAQATPEEQAHRALALGYSAVAARFFWFGGKRFNVTALNDEQLAEVDNAFRSRGIAVRVIASPIGKCWLTPEGGPKHARFMTDAEISTQIDGAERAAKALGAQAVRIFSGYPSDWLQAVDHPEQVVPMGVPLMKMISGRLSAAGLLGFVECEKYLVGSDGETILDLINQTGGNNLLVALDPGNLQHVGYSQAQIREQVRMVMQAGKLGSIHLKEVGNVPAGVDIGNTDFTESMLAPYHVVAGTGQAGFAGIFQEVGANWAANQAAWDLLAKYGIPGLDCMVEGHLNSGGPFHGSSGPDGVAKIQYSMAGIWAGAGLTVA